MIEEIINCIYLFFARLIYYIHIMHIYECKHNGSAY